MLPFVALLLGSLAVSFQYMPNLGRVVSVGVASAGVLLLFSSYDSVRFVWAIRALGASVFCGYLLYLISELRSGQAFRPAEPPSETSPRNALLGLIFFGLPGLRIALHPGGAALDPADSARRAEAEDPDDDD